MNDFMFGMKTDIRFAQGLVESVGEIAKEYGGQHVLLVADKGIRSTGLPERIEKCLKEVGVKVTNFDQVVPNPRITDCEEGARLGLEEKVNMVVAVGGGSSIDTAKAIAGMLGHSTIDFDVIKYPKGYTCNPYPLLVIPTTAGTGSEVTTCGVITDEKTHKKEYCYDVKCAPTVAICDPEVLMTLPINIAAACGIDALTHAIEGYVCKCTNSITEAMGLYAVKMLYDNFRKYIYDRDIESCKAILVGSMMAGISFGYSDTASVHSLAETLGGYYDIPHGVANAIFLAEVCKYSAPADVEKYSNVAKAIGVRGEGLSDREVAAAGAETILQLVEDVNIPKLNSYKNIDPKDFDFLAERCVEHISSLDNPRLFTKADYLYLLNKAYRE